MDILRDVAKAGIGCRMPDDPFFAEGDAVSKAWSRLGVLEIDEEALCHSLVTKFPCDIPGCTVEFDSLLQYELHYNTSHRYFCSECKKHLPSPHILELHVLENHDSFFLAQAERKPMYGCYIEECPLKFSNAQQRHRHCICEHQFPPDFRFDESHKQNSKKKRDGKKKKEYCRLKMDTDQIEIRKTSSTKKKQKNIKHKAENMDSSNEIRAGTKDVEFNDNRLKQSMKENEDMKSELHVETDSSEIMEECGSNQENISQMTKNAENALREKKTDCKKTCKASFQSFTFGRGQSKSGKFVPWHKSTVHKNASDTNTDMQIWENSNLMDALEQTVMNNETT